MEWILTHSVVGSGRQRHVRVYQGIQSIGGLRYGLDLETSTHRSRKMIEAWH